MFTFDHRASYVYDMEWVIIDSHESPVPPTPVVSAHLLNFISLHPSPNLKVEALRPDNRWPFPLPASIIQQD